MNHFQKIMGMALMGMSLSASLDAQQTDFGGRDVGAAALTIQLGSRAAGMGEAFVALADDASALLWNPAGLSQLESSQIQAIHQIYLEDISLEGGLYAQKLGQNQAIGVGIKYANLGAVDQVELVGGLPRVTGTEYPNAFQVIGGYSHRLIKEVMVGATVKYNQENLGGSSVQGMGIDLGGLWTISGNFQAGMNIQNLWGMLTQESKTRPLILAGVCVGIPLSKEPVAYWSREIRPKQGSSFLRNPLKFSLEGELPSQDPSLWIAKIGGEFKIENFKIRAGYKLSNADLNRAVGFSAGAGFALGFLQLDYAIQLLNDLDPLHQLGLQVSL